ncbi:hypothetical protein ANN_01871 [Periplaneta americana]|uniref:Uncharacterized protein n=1 Tax=Periplaneta americana TaxID=6978 RepID=A0ABQ8TUQ2_PERAM|nr:hypothetical protein ANN_01871 [Periplaneta americana]
MAGLCEGGNEPPGSLKVNKNAEEKNKDNKDKGDDKNEKDNSDDNENNKEVERMEMMCWEKDGRNCVKISGKV